MIPLTADPHLDQLIQDMNPEEERVKAALSDERAAIYVLGRMNALNVWNQALVNIISGLFPQKQVQKELKRLAYIFSQKGIKTYLPQESADSEATTGPKSLLKEAWSTFPFMTDRWRYVCLKFSKSAWVFLYLSPYEGIREIHDGKDEQFLMISKKLKDELVRVPTDYAALVLNLAKRKIKDLKLLKMVEDLERLINIREPAEIDKLFDFNHLLERRISALNRDLDLQETLVDMNILLNNHNLLDNYLEDYKKAANPRIILDQFLIQSRKMDIIDKLTDEVLGRRDDLIFDLKEDIFLLSLADKDITFGKSLLLKIFMEVDISGLKKALELLLDAKSYLSEVYKSKIITP